MVSTEENTIYSKQANLVLAVTGHRNLEGSNKARIRDDITAVLELLERRGRNTRILVISQLAEGADRLVVRVAREQLGERLELIVPLPMDQASYEEDFGGDSLTEFRDLISMASSVIEMPWFPGHSAANTRNTASDDPEADANATRRALQYALGGLFMLHFCDVLLVLWDGVENDRMGGTCWTKNQGMKKSSEKEQLEIWHIDSPRRGFYKADPHEPMLLTAPLAEPSDLKMQSSRRDIIQELLAHGNDTEQLEKGGESGLIRQLINQSIIDLAM